MEGAWPPGPSCVVSRGVLIVGGIAGGLETRSVTGAIRVDLSLYPTRKPSEKKTPQTATPVRNTKASCRAESPLPSEGVAGFLNMFSLTIDYLKHGERRHPGRNLVVRAGSARSQDAIRNDLVLSCGT